MARIGTLNDCKSQKFVEFRKNSVHSAVERGAIARDNGRIDVNDFYVAGIPDDR